MNSGPLTRGYWTRMFTRGFWPDSGVAPTIPATVHEAYVALAVSDDYRCKVVVTAHVATVVPEEL